MNLSDAPSSNPIGTSRKGSGLRLLVMCAASLAAGIIVAGWLENRSVLSYAGSLQSRTTVIASERTGRIDEIKLVIGQRIVPGDKLLQMRDDQLSSQILDKQRTLVEMEAELKRVQATADVEVEWRQRELSSEIFQTQLKLSTVSQERLAKQVEQLAWQDQIKSLQSDRMGPEMAGGLLPIRSVIIDSPIPDERRLQAIVREDAAASAAEALSAQLALCEEQVERLRKLEKELPGKVRLSAGVDLMETRIARVREELASLEKQQESLTVASRVHGVVGAIRHKPGDLVRAGDSIVELLDDDCRHLIAYIPSSAATKLHAGSKVELEFPGKQTRFGLIAAIPPQAIPADKGILSADSQVEVTIEPSGKLWPKLPIGSRVQVKVLE